MYCKGKPLGCASHAREPQTKHVNAAAFRSKQEDATTWLVPKLVSEVKFIEWTSEGEMRHPVFLGLRTDKKGQRRYPRTSMRSFSMEVRSDHFEAAKSHFFDTSSWGPFCDVTLTLKQALQSDSGAWMKITDHLCRQAHRHFMNLLNRAVFGVAFRRYGKRLRVLPVLEKGEVRTRTLRSWEFGKSGRWHIHCAIELPSHFDAIALEKLIRKCWAKVEWGYSRILIRDGANNGWINYMLKGRQKSAFDNFLDCIVIESLHNPIVGA
jgi:hypothetical protein